MCNRMRPPSAPCHINRGRVLPRLRSRATSGDRLARRNQKVSKLSWLERTANNRKVRGSSPRGTTCFMLATRNYRCGQKRDEPR